LIVSALIREKWWLVANVIGVAAYLHFSSKTWLEPELRGEAVARGGDAVVWALSALPVLATVLVADLMWLSIVTRRGSRTKDWRAMFALFCVGAIWVGTVVIDQLGRDGWLPLLR